MYTYKHTSTQMYTARLEVEVNWLTIQEDSELVCTDGKRHRFDFTAVRVFYLQLQLDAWLTDILHSHTDPCSTHTHTHTHSNVCTHTHPQSNVVHTCVHCDVSLPLFVCVCVCVCVCLSLSPSLPLLLFCCNDYDLHSSLDINHRITRQSIRTCSYLQFTGTQDIVHSPLN